MLQQREQRVIPVMLDVVWDHAGHTSDIAYTFVRTLIAMANTFDWRKASALVLITADEDATSVLAKTERAVKEFCAKGYEHGFVIALFGDNPEAYKVVKARWGDKIEVMVKPYAADILRCGVFAKHIC